MATVLTIRDLSHDVVVARGRSVGHEVGGVVHGERGAGGRESEEGRTHCDGGFWRLKSSREMDQVGYRLGVGSLVMIQVEMAE